MLVMRRLITSLGSQEAGVLNDTGAVRHQCPTTRSSNYLISVERQHTHIAKCAALPAVDRRAQSLGCVLQHRYAVLLRYGRDLSHLGRHAIQVHRYYSLWRLALG